MLTYKDSGVSIEKNDRLVTEIASLTSISTGFSATHLIPGTDQYLVQCTDGVGTKIHFARQFRRLYHTIGQDLVAMCVNDLICSGAAPAFFQDYIGMNSLDDVIVRDIILSIYKACEMGGVELTGGEMAEMPGSYAIDTPELVGFATGFTDDEHLIDKYDVNDGNVIIGLPSSGPHSNGYSLIRKIFDKPPYRESVLRELLAPTEIYYDVSRVYQEFPWLINSMAHITGGGLENNLARAIPEGLKAKIKWTQWDISNIYVAIQNLGDVEPIDMWNTFNMGVGMCLIVDQRYATRVMEELSDSKQTPFIMGEIVEA